MSTSDPAANREHRAQDVSHMQENWDSVRESAVSDAAAFNAMLLDVFGEAPPPEVDPSSELSREAREAVLNEYLEAMPLKERIVMIRHYGLWGTKSPAETTSAGLDISEGQYEELLARAKVALETRKNEFFKELAVTAAEANN